LVKFLILPEREYGHRKISVKAFNFYCLLFTEVWDVSPPSGKSYINVTFGKCNCNEGEAQQCEICCSGYALFFTCIFFGAVNPSVREEVYDL